jgi:LacI family transcriptional regulator/LacI family repressor for deo operon, udp, cdd, tsx, nupC, and nupG
MATPTTKNPTISDVARLAGVSKSTVSAVLNNKSSIRESTRRTVVRAMEELAYRPSPSARRGFRPAQGKSIAFVVKESSNPYYAEVLGGIEEVAAERGYLVSVSSSGGDYEREHRIVEQCTEHEVDGLIITPIRHDDSDLSHIFELKRSNAPFVLLEKVPGIQASLVDVDNVRGSWEAVKYLIEQGHARIAHLAGPPYSEHSRERADGVRRAFSESQLVFDESMIVPAGDSLEEGYRAGLEYFRDRAAADRPTAVTCYNDLVAIGLLKALRELAIRVPEDISVIGFDQLQLLDYLPLRLSTVSIPKHEMGKRAAELLIRQIETSRDLPAEKVVLETELVLRDSTRPPRKRT